MLTRHFYRYDEVRAALLWCIAKGRVLEGIFWAQELLDSELYDEFFQALFEGWLWFVGVRRLEWVRLFWNELRREEVDAEQMMRLAYTLLRLPVRDCSVVALLVLGPEKQALDRLPPTPKTDIDLRNSSYTNEQQTLVKYMRTGKALSAWRLACSVQWEPFECDLHVSALKGIYGQYFTGDEDMDLAIRATVLGIHCLSPKQRAASTATLELSEWKDDVVKARAEWEALLGHRGRRVYAIPRDCLAWMSSRGYVTYQKHTLRELRGVGMALLREKGCPYWQRRLEEDEPWRDDTVYEDFMDTEFPDDIPDEWSKPDQEKSHGYGPLSLTEKRMLGKLLRKWYQGQGMTCSLVWAGLEKMVRRAETLVERVWWGSEHAQEYSGLVPPQIPPQALKLEVRPVSLVAAVQQEMQFVAAPVKVQPEVQEEEEGVE